MLIILRVIVSPVQMYLGGGGDTMDWSLLHHHSVFYRRLNHQSSSLTQFFEEQVCRKVVVKTLNNSKSTITQQETSGSDAPPRGLLFIFTKCKNKVGVFEGIPRPPGGRAGSENDTPLPLTMTHEWPKFWNDPPWCSKVIGLKPWRQKNKNKKKKK